MEHLRELSFDNAVAWLLNILGVNAAVVLLVKLAFNYQSWRDGISKTSVLIRSVIRLATRVGGLLSATHDASRTTNYPAVVVVVFAQVLTVGLFFIFGNAISVILDADHRELLAEALRGSHLPGYGLPACMSSLTIDVYSAAYVAAGVFTLMKSYSLDPYSSQHWNDGYANLGGLLALPAILVLVIGCPVALVLLAMQLGTLGLVFLTGDSPQLTHSFERYVDRDWPVVLVFGICFAYWKACAAAVRGSRCVQLLLADNECDRVE